MSNASLGDSNIQRRGGGLSTLCHIMLHLQGTWQPLDQEEHTEELTPRFKLFKV